MATFFAFSPPPKLAKLLDTEDETVCVCLAKFPQVCACQTSVAVCMALLHSCRLTLDEGFVIAPPQRPKACFGTLTAGQARSIAVDVALPPDFKAGLATGHCMAAVSCMHITSAGCTGCA